jgi:hypothetical protein
MILPSRGPRANRPARAVRPTAALLRFAPLMESLGYSSTAFADAVGAGDPADTLR